jgi:hypothetical protein
MRTDIMAEFGNFPWELFKKILKNMRRIANVRYDCRRFTFYTSDNASAVQCKGKLCIYIPSPPACVKMEFPSERVFQFSMGLICCMDCT